MPQLWHETLYTVVSDPLHGLTTCERYRDAVDAQRAADRINQTRPKSAYVLPPGGPRE